MFLLFLVDDSRPILGNSLTSNIPSPSELLKGILKVRHVILPLLAHKFISAHVYVEQGGLIDAEC